MSEPVAVKTGTFQYGSYQLAYEQYGDEGIPCILLHGILLDAGINRELARRFTREGYKVVLLDLLGHGRSDRTTDPKDHRCDFYAEQVLACMDHLGFAKAMVGGVSLGCMVSLHVAAKAPGRVLALFLEMPVMEWSAPWAAVILAPALFSSRFLRVLHTPFAAFMRKLPRPRLETLASVMNTLSMEPAHVAAILHGTLVGSMVPSERERKAMTMPALVIGHNRDKLHEFEDARVLASELPNAQLIEAKHMLELRLRPDRLWKDIVKFLDQVSSAQKQARPLPTVVSFMYGSGAAVAAKPTAQAVPAADPDLVAQFKAAVEKVRSAPANGPLKPSNEMKLRMYALYRQAQDGDASGQRPGITDPVGRFKYDAWTRIKGTSKEQAMRQYLDEIAKVEQKHSA